MVEAFVVGVIGGVALGLLILWAIKQSDSF